MGLGRPQETYYHGRKGSKHVLLHMVAVRRSARQNGEHLCIKPADVVRIHSLSREQQHGGNSLLTIELPLTRSFPQHMRIIEAAVQDKIWVGTQPNHITTHSQLITKTYLLNLQNVFQMCPDLSMPTAIPST